MIMRKLEMSEMEMIQGGGCSFGVSIGCAFVALAFGLGTSPWGGFVAGLACDYYTGSFCE
jgi:hypothetical protein